MKNVVRSLLLLTIAFAALPSWAGLDGTQVTGGLFLNNNGQIIPNPVNFFDPRTGDVPPGFKNDLGVTVTIGPGDPDFGSEVGGNLFTANFTDNQLTITQDEDRMPVPPFKMTFVDPAFLSITKVFDNFDHGGITFSLVGDEIILTRNRDVSLDDHYAIFDIGTASPPPIPEPGSLLLLGTGLLAAATASRRKQAIAL